MAKNDVAVDYYDLHEITLAKDCFMLYRADTDKEIWVLGPRGDGQEIYLRQKRFDWPYWNRKTMQTSKQPSRPKVIAGPRLYCFAGPLSEAMAKLKKVGIEEEHVELSTARGVWT